MISLNRVVLEGFSKEIDKTSFQVAYNSITEHLNQAITTIKQRNPYITNSKIFVANEMFCGTEYFGSGLDIFIVFEAKQIELNYNNKKNNKLKRNLRYFWNSFRNNLKLFSSKKKKADKFVKEVEKSVISLNDYDVELLYKDIIVNLSKTLYNQTSIKLNKNKITIVGEEEFGIDINIYPVFSTDDRLCKLYNIYSQKNIIVDNKKRFKNIGTKNEITDNAFTRQIRIFNNLYCNSLKQKPNQIFIESLLYACPDSLFEGQNSVVTINILNYIKNTSLQNMRSICDENTKLFNEPLNTTSLETAIKFVNNVSII